MAFYKFLSAVVQQVMSSGRASAASQKFPQLKIYQPANLEVDGAFSLFQLPF